MNQIERKFKLNDKLIYPSLNLIESKSTSLRVAPKVMKLLCYFIQNPNRVITTQEITQQVWQANFVSNSAIQRVIGLIRKALDDDSKNPQYLETIAKQGYRLIARVECINPEEDIHLVENNLKRPRTYSWLPISLIMVTILVLSYWLVATQNNSKLKISNTISKLSSLNGQEIHPAISPNGKMVAYINKKTNSDVSLYLQVIGESQVHELVKSQNSLAFPQWSSQGNSIAVVSRNTNSQNSCAVNKIQFDIAKIEPVKTTTLFDCSDFYINGLVWQAQKSLLIFSANNKLTSQSQVYQYNTATKRLKQLTVSVVEGWGDRVLDITSNSQSVLFLRNHFLTSDSLYELDLTTQKTKELFRHTEIIQFAKFGVTDKTLFLTSKNRLYQYDLMDGTLQPVNNSLGYHSFDVFELPFQIVAARMEQITDIYQLNLDDLITLDKDVSLTPKKKISSTKMDYMPSAFNNSNDILFISDRSGGSQIWRTRESNKQQQITSESFDFTNTTLRIHPNDDKAIFFARKDLFLLDLQKNKITKLNTGLDYSDLANWSQDGKHIYFWGIDNDIEQIWQIDPVTLEKKQITQNGGIMSAEAPNRKGLYFTKRNEQGLWLHTFADSSEKLVFPNFPKLLQSGLIMTNDGIIFLERTPSETKLNLLSIPSHELIELYKMPNSIPGHLSYSKFDHSIYYVQTEKISSDLDLRIQAL